MLEKIDRQMVENLERRSRLEQDLSLKDEVFRSRRCLKFLTFFVLFCSKVGSDSDVLKKFGR